MKKIVSKHGFITTKQRSETMKKIKSENTKPEVIFRKALWASGIRYRTYYKQLYGKPDITITKHKISIFIDGSFWHGFNWQEKKKKIKANRDYWVKKIEGNIERDKKVNNKLKEDGWLVVRFWDFEIKNDIEGCLKKVEEAVRSRIL